MALSPADLDAILTLQLGVAYAGEHAAETGQPAARLGWWNTDLYDEDGGIDLFSRLTPRTALWATLQAARIAAIAEDTKRRTAVLAKPDAAVSLFHLGFAVDEALEARLAHHKRSRIPPTEALPELAEILHTDPAAFDRSALSEWLLGGAAPPNVSEAPAGREIRDEAPRSPRARAQVLAAALLPLPADGRYPTPHWMLEARVG